MAKLTKAGFRLRPWHVDILTFLAASKDDGGWSSGHIGKQVWLSMAPRSASGAALGNLTQMRVRGLVELIDDRKPLAWRITPAGRAALANDGGR